MFPDTLNENLVNLGIIIPQMMLCRIVITLLVTHLEYWSSVIYGTNSRLQLMKLQI